MEEEEEMLMVEGRQSEVFALVVSLDPALESVPLMAVSRVLS